MTILTQTLNKNVLYKQYLSHVYHNIPPSLSNSSAISDITQTNGEILFEDKLRLFNLINVNSNDILYDLGSGEGKVVLQAYLQTPIKKMIGIEIRPDLYNKAIYATNIIKRDLPELFNTTRFLNFQLGSFFQKKFDDASILIINSTCFTQIMLLKLGQLINQFQSIRCVISLRPILNLKNLKLVHVKKIQCSWDAVLAYIYQ